MILPCVDTSLFAFSTHFKSYVRTTHCKCARNVNSQYKFVGVSVRSSLAYALHFIWGRSGSVVTLLDSGPRGRGFEPHWCHCLVSLSKNINPSVVLVQPRKTRLFTTGRLLMGHKEYKIKQTKTFFIHLLTTFCESY